MLYIKHEEGITILSIQKHIFSETDMFYTHPDRNMRTDRESYLGGSDSDAFGSQITKEPYLWSTPFTVWFKKKRFHLAMVNNGFSNKSITAMHDGTLAEARLRSNTREYLKNIYSKEFEVFTSPATYRMKAYPFVGANIDGLLKDVYGNYSGLEIKTTSYKKAWLENKYSGVPFGYWCQVQHYMMVLGLPRFYMICEYKTKERYSEEIIEKGVIARVVESDPKFQKDLLDVYMDFWENNILKDIPPELKGISREEFYYPYLPEKYVTKDARKIKKIQRFLENKEIIKDLENVNEELKGEIIEMIGGEEGCFILEEYKIKLQTLSIRRFLKDKFKEDYPELCKEYTCIEKGYKSLRVCKLKKEVKE